MVLAGGDHEDGPGPIVATVPDGSAVTGVSLRPEDDTNTNGNRAAAAVPGTELKAAGYGLDVARQQPQFPS